MRTFGAIGRVIAVGGTAGTIGALLASALAAAIGMEALAPELTAAHIVAASLVANLAGAAAFSWLRARRADRAVRWYVLITLGAATVASARVLVASPMAGFAAVAVPVHYVVAAASAIVIPWFFAQPASRAPRAATRALVTLVALVTSISPEIADFNATHLENPQWPAHARYHGVLLACTMVVTGAVSIAMVWRPVAQAERRLRVAIATGLPAAIWGGFWLALAFPDASSWPDGAARPLAIAPNVILAGVIVLLAATAWWLDRADRGAVR